MPRFSWSTILAWALAAFFLVGSVVNISAPASVVEQYRSWGYPDWFHFVTGGLELKTAFLLALTATRRLGAVLGCVVMLAAATTVVVHGEYAHAAPPVIILILAAVSGWTSPRTRLSDAP